MTDSMVGGLYGPPAPLPAHHFRAMLSPSMYDRAQAMLLDMRFYTRNESRIPTSGKASTIYTYTLGVR